MRVDVYAVCVLFMLLMDAIYFSFTKDIYRRNFESVSGENWPGVRWDGVVMSYILVSLCLYIVSLRARDSFEAGMVGLVVYGIYNSVNYATLNGYSFNVGLMDTIWGGILFLSVYKAVRVIVDV